MNFNDLLEDSSSSDEELIIIEKEFSKRMFDTFDFDWKLINSLMFPCLFRFEKEDFMDLFTNLRFPPFFIAKNRSKVDGRLVLCLVLRRLAYPNRLVDLVPLFGRIRSDLSMFFNAGMKE